MSTSIVAMVIIAASGSACGRAAVGTDSAPSRPTARGDPSSLVVAPGTVGTEPTDTTGPASSAPTSSVEPTTSATPPVTTGRLPVLSGGSWVPLGQPVFGRSAMYVSLTTGPSPGSGSALAAVWMDPNLVRFTLHPGKVEPGGTWSTPPQVTPQELPGLLAAFNGGFKFKDAKGGFFADNRASPPLQVGAATLEISDNGSLRIATWGQPSDPGFQLVQARQNLGLLVDDGRPTALASNTASWGATVHGAQLVWRSALGVTADGAVLYVAGPSQSASSLAAGLVQFGATRAMELDINQSWVTFNTYTHDSSQPSIVQSHKLVPAMAGTDSRYLQPDTRDFLTVISRETPAG